MMREALSPKLGKPASQLGDLGPTAELARWAAAIEFEHLPADIVSEVRTLLVDFVRVAAIGAATPWGGETRRVMSELGGAPRSTVLVYGDRTDPARAAFLNGCFAHGADTDDTHVGGMIHPGAVVIPAALAVAESVFSTGQEFIAGVVAGYEAAIRVALSVQPSHFKRGFQATGTCGVFGAAVAAGRILRLSEAQMAGALGMAGSFAGGLAQFYFSGSLVKRVHAGRAAEAGVTSAVLAGHGLYGPSDILEGEAGFAHAYADAFDPPRITSGLGVEYRMREVTIKPNATSARLQASVEAMLRLVGDHHLFPEQIVSVRVGIPSVISGRLTQSAPGDCSAAQLSLPFTIGLAAVIGRERGSQTFLTVDDYQSHLEDRQVRRIAGTTVCEVDPEIEAATTEVSVPSTVSIRLADGHELLQRVEFALGSPGRPFDDGALRALFGSVAGLLPRGGSPTEILAAIDALSAGAPVATLTSLLGRH